MALVNLTEAAKLVGMTRKTIGRHVQSGKLSIQMIDNAPKVDTSELLRVYGAFKNNNYNNMSSDNKNKMSIKEDGQKINIESSSSHEYENLNDENYLLKLEVSSTKKELEMLRLLMEEKDRHIDTLKSEITHTRLLLENKTEKPSSENSNNRWWQIWK